MCPYAECTRTLVLSQEFAFSSTTLDALVAANYAKKEKQAKGGKVASTMFRAAMGMINRGADFSWLSQFAHEREVVFPPLVRCAAHGHYRAPKVVCVRG